MNLLRVLVVITLLIISLASCKKDDSNQSPAPRERIKTYTETLVSSSFGTLSYTYNLSYDQDGRLLSMVNAESAGDRFVFTYGQAGFNMEIFGNNDLVIHQDVFLNGNLMDSTFQYNNEGDTTTEKYFYNGDNMLVTLNRYSHSGDVSVLDEVVTYTYDANKNLTREASHYGSINYEYDAATPEIIDLFPVYFSYSKQLPSKVTSTYLNHDYVAEHSYSLDAKNRLVSDVATFINGDVVTKTFTYE